MLDMHNIHIPTQTYYYTLIGLLLLVLINLVLKIIGAIIIHLPFLYGTKCFRAEDVCPSEHISFWLRTGNTDKSGFEIIEANIEKLPVIEEAPLKVLIHGYTGHKDYSPNPELVDAYLKKGNYNIISMDWGKMARDGCYIQATFNVAVAGKCAARLLQQIYTRKSSAWKKQTHVIGFSLGAHVAGVLGYNLPGLPRITGLDPAFPGFSKVTSKPEFRLDPSDAVFVDTYHTNAWTKGRPGTLGHVDFYINNGASQPGCSDSSCNHRRAPLVFAESIINPEGFFGQPCKLQDLSYVAGISKELCSYINGSDIFVRAGENINTKVSGVYKFETNSYIPLSKGLPKNRKRNAKIM